MSPSTRQSLPTGTVTFLFTDIEGSTRLVQSLGDDWVPVLEAHNSLIETAITENNGVVVKTEGDSFFAVFAAAVEALHASVQAQHALMDYSWPPDGVVRSRMGLHTGIGALGASDYVGLDVHRAARIADSAHGGQVVLSEPTAVLVERSLPADVSLRDLGKHRLKDLAEPEAILQVVVAGLQSEFPLLRTLDAIPNNLPKLLTSFVGRDRELAEAMRLLGTTRILTFTGPGGTGKTRLSLQLAAEVADAYPDGVFFVDLAPINDVAVIPSRILETLGIQVSTRKEPPAMRLNSQLADKGILLILDNFEQLLDGAPLVAEMLRASPRTKVLVTSRAPLRISGEQELPVPPLGISGVDPDADLETLMESEAIRLFTDRAMAVRPDFRLSAENAPAVAKLVGRLDGLPLAIELVASRLRLLPVDQILSRLSARMLSSGSVDLLARQRTIESAIAWSYELLAEPERKLFARFAIFSAGARLEEVEAVCGPPEELGQDVIDSLSTLVEQSLIRRVDDEGRLRFRMLHVIQEFALERLTESGEAAALARRHLETYAAYVESVAPELLGRDRRMWLDVLEQDQDNLRAALDWAVESGEPDLAFRLSSAAWRLWQARGHLHEARRRLDEVLALEGGDPRNRAKALEALGGILWWQSDLDGALEIYRETVRMHRVLGDPRELANALYNVSLATVFVQDANASRDALDEAEVLYRELGDVGGLGDVEWGRGNFTAYVDGDIPSAIAHMKKSIEYYEKAGNEFGMGWGTFEVGHLSRQIGDYDQSWQYISRGLELFSGHHDVSGIVLLLAACAGLALILGDRDRAHRLAGAFHGLRISSGTEIVLNELNRIEALDYETMEALSGEAAIAYREGKAMSLEAAVTYALTGPADV
ncbi:MAG: adenylate/guanylate cyclase domain-containing protein [Acidimicrobiia bacterium]